MKQGAKFNWKCAHCGKRNIIKFKFQFDIPQEYHMDAVCDKCNEYTELSFKFNTEKVFVDIYDE